VKRKIVGVLGLLSLIAIPSPVFAVIFSVNFSGSSPSYSITSSQLISGAPVNDALHITVHTSKDDSLASGLLLMSATNQQSTNTFNLQNGTNTINATINPSAGSSTSSLSGVTDPFRLPGFTVTENNGVYDAAINLSGFSTTLPAGAYTSTLTATFVGL
jgi:hypothetical protein